MNKDLNFYSAKCYFSFPGRLKAEGSVEIGYEQRVVLLKAKNDDDAISQAEVEAKNYANSVHARFLDFVEVFEVRDFAADFEGVKEVYSITFYDDPDEEEFLDNYYLTGGNAKGAK